MKQRNLSLIFLTAIISGFSVFINKYGVAMSNPYVFAFLKNSVVAIFLISLVILLKQSNIFRKLTKKQWLLMAAIGLIGGSIPFLLFFKGLVLTSAAQASFIQKTMFVFATIFAIVFLKEKISKNFLIGALILLAANILMLKSFNFVFGWGDILILLAMLFWAAENVLSKYVLRDLDGKTVAWGRMFFGSIFIYVFLAASGQTGLITTVNAQQIIWVLITSVLLAAYVLTWYSGLKNTPVSLATSILLLGAPITTALTAISIGKISTQEVIAGVLVILGLLGIFGISKLKIRNCFNFVMRDF